MFSGADTAQIPEAIDPAEESSELDGAKQGENDFDEVGYRGPCPLAGDDPHEYRFTLHVLDAALDADGGAPRPDVEDELDAKTRDSDQFTGTFARS
ncbi:YbhB/YbcL family Raf kinase inhibitor-like protein [Halorussus lipolyticus]|uniref:YbhB/YbcL family Raf kinase inhibitor-like protein n=1 Tax=Halorussus lipolyticus TaxID=3034024 RepID=UPI0023E8A43F|nr:hypothetical protein [Halorussus sp. DT80]